MERLHATNHLPEQTGPIGGPGDRRHWIHGTWIAPLVRVPDSPPGHDPPPLPGEQNEDGDGSQPPSPLPQSPHRRVRRRTAANAVTPPYVPILDVFGRPLLAEWEPLPGTQPYLPVAGASSPPPRVFTLEQVIHQSPRPLADDDAADVPVPSADRAVGAPIPAINAAVAIPVPNNEAAGVHDGQHAAGVSVDMEDVTSAAVCGDQLIDSALTTGDVQGPLSNVSPAASSSREIRMMAERHREAAEEWRVAGNDLVGDYVRRYTNSVPWLAMINSGSMDPLARTAYWNDVLDRGAAHRAEIARQAEGWDDDDDNSSDDDDRSSDDDSDDGSGEWADSDDEVDQDMGIREAMGRPVLIDRPLVGQQAAGDDDGDDDDGDPAPSEGGDDLGGGEEGDVGGQGADGGDGRRRGPRRTVTCREHGAYHVQIRADLGGDRGDSRNLNPGEVLTNEMVHGQQHLLRGDRLLQEFIVDVCCQVENHRIKWIRDNQTTLRADLYSNVRDHVLRAQPRPLDPNQAAPPGSGRPQPPDTAGPPPPLPSAAPNPPPSVATADPPSNRRPRGADVGVRVNQNVILPGSFNGGPRCMLGLYQDAMAVIRKLGKPDLFLTFTCNPKWPEILSAAIPGQTASARCDLIAR